MAKYDTLSIETGLSKSTIYRRLRNGYTEKQIREEARLRKKYGSGWKKQVGKEKSNMSKRREEVQRGMQVSLPTITGNEKEVTLKDLDIKGKRLAHWEPADDYGLISRLKVLGGWIIKLENEVMFVSDPKHKWEV